MNKKLYTLCSEYSTCFETILLLINIDGVESERLKLFRLMQDRMKELESEIETCIVENDLINNMTEKGVKQ